MLQLDNRALVRKVELPYLALVRKVELPHLHDTFWHLILSDCGYRHAHIYTQNSYHMPVACALAKAYTKVMV